MGRRKDRAVVLGGGMSSPECGGGEHEKAGGRPLCKNGPKWVREKLGRASHRGLFGRDHKVRCGKRPPRLLRKKTTYSGCGRVGAGN